MIFTKNTFICFSMHAIYFRIYGYGLSFNFNSLPLFSERMGISKPLLRFKKFTIKILKP